MLLAKTLQNSMFLSVTDYVKKKTFDMTRYCGPVEKYGNHDQKTEYLIPCASGEHLGCFMLSEPGNGSDAGAANTTAADSGAHWVLNGSKAWITNAHDSKYGVVLATTDKTQKHKVVYISSLTCILFYHIVPESLTR
jgi:alkylation response protein AidB-like acyl-CoA dehydrogenase